MSKPTAAQLRKINAFAKEPLSEENTYAHKFRLIGTRFIPSRHLKIDRSLLSIYKKFVENGDVVQIADHSFGGWFNSNITLPFGRFFEGVLVEEDGETHLDGTMYMKAAQKTYLPGGFTTDDINDQLDAGTLHDSSVTISWGKSECSICGNDIRDYENCPHIPTLTYKVQGKDMLCFVIAKPAERNDRSAMIENSIVCAGAYPDAGTLGALSEGGVKPPGESRAEGGQKSLPYREITSMAELKLVQKDVPVFCLLSASGSGANLLVKPDDLRSKTELHELYHQMYSAEGLPEGWTMAKLVRQHSEAAEALIESQQAHYLADALDGTLPANLKKLSQTKEIKQAQKGSDQGVELIQKLCELLGCTQDELFAKVEGLKTGLSAAQATQATQAAAIDEKDKEITRLSPFEAKAKELEPLAEIGKQYREDLVNEALAWGVKAYGNTFNEEVNRKMLSNTALSLDDIKAMKAQYEGVAREAITSGRISSNDSGSEGTKAAVDDSVYSSK